MVLARIVVLVGINGAGAQMEIGVAGDAGLIVPSDSIDAATAGEYETTPDVHLLAGQGIMLTITPGAGATQGSGFVYLGYVND